MIASSEVATTIDLTLYSACPLCGCGQIPEFALGDCGLHATYQPGLSRSVLWKHCGGCGHIFREGYFPPDALRTVLAKTMNMQIVGTDYEAARIQTEKTIDLVLPYVTAGVWLDVGFGDGALLRTVQEFGFSPLGIDLRPNNVEALRQLGIPAFCADITEVVADPPCRVVSLQYVLAHMPFPRAALGAAWRLLDDGGLLLISTPNLESSLWAEWNRAGTNPYWGEIECCHHFGRTRLYELLRGHGFELLRFSLGQRYRACMEVLARKCPE